MSDLATWLTEVLHEDLEVARNAGPRQQFHGLYEHDDDYHYPLHVGALTVVADAEAKLAIVDLHGDINDGNCSTCVHGKWGYPVLGGSIPSLWPCQTLRLLAWAYRDRGGWDETWAPEVMS